MRNAFSKRQVFNCLLKLSIELVSVINLGRAFHDLDEANTKAHSPRVALSLIFGKLSKIPSLELLKLYLDTGLEVIKELKYEGARPLKILKTINRILNSVLNFWKCHTNSVQPRIFHIQHGGSLFK